ncbi:alpha/beta hydrolase [Rhodococcus sovatensis]|uniref:Alpha/beta hydrolase n=1 Tax=Rhodococcus sovatensis TaxID=1805840 RepID=A0ABZ2PLE6_9NOCA
MQTTARDLLPSERPGRPASPELVGRRAQFTGTAVESSTRIEPEVVAFGGVSSLVLHGGDNSTILYLHGGGYRMGSPEAYTAYGTKLAHAAGATVVLPEYRLAPEHPFPAGLRDAVAVYESLVDQTAGPIFVAGDSAGAGLALASTMSVVAAGSTPPAGLMLLSPWLDLSCESPCYATSTDPYFSLATALSAREDYLQGSEHSDPLVSPLLADLSLLPAVLVQVGGIESLVGDALELTRVLATANRSCLLEVVADQGHTWPLIFPDHPDSTRSIRSIGNFARSITERRTAVSPTTQ